jgi:Spy/CpxP family protein refolding chaperone
MKIRQILIAAAATCAISAGAAIAHPEGGGWGHGEGMEILHSLNLTDAQKEQVHGIEKAAWAQARPIMEQMHAVHEQLATALLASGNVTADQLAPMVTQEEQLRTQMDQMHLNTVLQVRALLTPEQLAQAGAVHQKLAALHDQEHAVIRASQSAP